MIDIKKLSASILDRSTIVQKYQQDVDDTIAKGQQVLGNLAAITDLDSMDLVDAVDATLQLDLPLRIGGETLDGEALTYYYVFKDTVTGLPVIGEYANGNLEKISDIFEVGTNNIVSLTDDMNEAFNLAGPTLAGLTANVKDTLDQANLVNNLISTLRSNSTSAISDFAALSRDIYEEGSSGAKAMYQTIMQSLGKCGGGAENIFVILSTIYSSIASMVMRDSVSFTYDETNYKVQGFVFSNIISAIADSVGNIVSLALTVVSPIAGIIAYGTSTMISTIVRGLDSIDAQSYSRVNIDSANRLFNIPIWHGEMVWDTLPTWSIGGRTIAEVVDQEGCAILTTPGLQSYIWQSGDPNKFCVEIYINCNVYPKLVNCGRVQTFDTYSGSGTPTDWYNGSNVLSAVFNPPLDDIFNNVPLTPSNLYGSKWAFENGWTEDADKLSWINVFAAFRTAFTIGATDVMGFQYDYDAQSSFYIDQIALHLSLCEASGWTPNWSLFVNTVIYDKVRGLSAIQARNLFFGAYTTKDRVQSYIRDASVAPVDFVAFDLGDAITLTGGVPIRDNFFITAPKYSPDAKWNVIGAAVAVTVTTALLCTAAAVAKTKIRNMQIKQYARVASAASALQNNPDDVKALNSYKKAVKKYNMCSSLFGYSTRLNMIDGWQEAKSADAKSQSSYVGIYETYQNVTKAKEDIGNGITENNSNIETIFSGYVDGFEEIVSTKFSTSLTTNNDVIDGLFGGYVNTFESTVSTDTGRQLQRQDLRFESLLTRQDGRFDTKLSSQDDRLELKIKKPIIDLIK